MFTAAQRAWQGARSDGFVGFWGLLLLLVLALSASAIEEDISVQDQPLATPEVVLPTFRPTLSLITNKSLAPGEFARNFSYDGANPLFSTGNMKLRYSQGMALFGDNAGASKAAWEIGFSVAPQAKGFSGSVRYSQTPDHVGSGAGPFAGGEMGLRRMDLRLGWQESDARSFSIARDRVSTLDGGKGFGRDAISAAMDGFTYTRENMSFDKEMSFSGGNNAMLLGDQGYALSGRKLGSSGSGYTNLAGLAGLTDNFEQLAYAKGKFEVRQWDRTLTQGEEKLHDFGQSARFGRVSFSRTAKSMTAGFAPLQQTGYQHFGGLRNGRLEELAANYQGTNWSAAWQQSLLSVGEGDGRSINRTSTYRVSAQPLTGLALNASHTTSVGGTAAQFAAPDRAKQITKSTSNHLDATFATGKHQFAGRIDLGQTTVGDRRTTNQDWEVGYQQGARTKINLREIRGDTIVTKEDGTKTHAPTWFQRLSFNTAFGLSYVRQLNSAGEGENRTSGRYELIRLEQNPIQALTVRADYERWRNASSGGYQVGTHKGMLDSAVPHAVGWTVAASYKPGKTTIDGQWKQLAWRQDGEARGFKAGDHNLSEWIVGISRTISPTFSVRGEWNMTTIDGERERERRELFLQYQPSSDPLVPLAEAGVREVLVGKRSTISPFARLKLQPYRGLAFEAALAQAAIDQAQMRDALTFSRQQKAALRFTATQTVGGDGMVKVEYSTQPRASAKPVELWEPGPLARTTAVEFSSPTKALLPGMRLTGRWERATEPEGGKSGRSELNTYRAGLAWKNGGHDLTVNYWLQTRSLPMADLSNSRLDLTYSADLAEAGKLSVTGYWNTDSAQNYNKRDEDRPENWRVGLLYNAGF